MTEYTGTQSCVCKIMGLAWLGEGPGETGLVPGSWGWGRRPWPKGGSEVVARGEADCLWGTMHKQG